MSEIIMKRCVKCGLDIRHSRVVLAGLVLWECFHCKYTSPFRLRHEPPKIDLTADKEPLKMPEIKAKI